MLRGKQDVDGRDKPGNDGPSAVPVQLARHHDQRVGPERACAFREAAELPEVAAGGEAQLDRETEALEDGREPITQLPPPASTAPARARCVRYARV